MEFLKSKPTLFTVILLGAIGTLFINFQPLLVGVVADSMGLGEKQMSYFASSDLIGYALASLTSFFWIKKTSWKNMALFGILLALIGNLIAIYTNDFSILMVARIVCGFGEGILTAIALAGIGMSSRPDANMAYFLAFFLIISATALFLLPGWIAVHAAIPIYVVLFVLTLVLVPLVLKFVPTKLGFTFKENTNSSFLNLFSKPVIIGLLGILIMYIGVGAFWAFVERLGALAGLSTEFISNAIGLSLIISLIGTVLPILLDVKLGRIMPIIVSLLVMIGSGLLLFGKITTGIYITGLSVFYVFWNIVLPYMVGLISETDSNDIGSAMVPAMFSIGAALGPLLASFFIESDDLSPAAWLLVISCIASGLMYWVVHRYSITKASN